LFFNPWPRVERVTILGIVNDHCNSDTCLLHITPNLLAGVEVTITGHNPDEDCVVGLAILPLNANYDPHKGLLPLDILIKPTVSGYNTRINKLDNLIGKALLNGFEPSQAIDVIDSWFNKIRFGEGANIIPLSANWCLKREFLIKCLGRAHFDKYFSFRYRDIIQVMCFTSDRHDFQRTRSAPMNTQVEKVSVNHLGHKIRVNALLATIGYARYYKRLVSRFV